MVSQGSYELKSTEMLVCLYRALQSAGASSGSTNMDSSQLCSIVLVSLKDLNGCLDEDSPMRKENFQSVSCSTLRSGLK